ncbi:baseplate assembly protein W [Vibrio cholerae]|uniref:Baseplate assembly protein W n=1 Tax=Vibrio cholerae TaxID=666 RepID=A0A7Z7VLF9_VIBCL|nr:baseplate assembly protein W [Vibrio cholerae]TBM39808.1 baseplate assembly protein W [Vibrio cholerae]
MKQGTDALTGKTIGGLDYLRQRLTDAFNTPLGSLVGARDYGSRLHEVVDRNLDQSFEMLCYVRISEAIAKSINGIDDFRLSEMQVRPIGQGQVEVDLYGLLIHNGQPVKLEGIIIDGRNN